MRTKINNLGTGIIYAGEGRNVGTAYANRKAIKPMKTKNQPNKKLKSIKAWARYNHDGTKIDLVRTDWTECDCKTCKKLGYAPVLITPIVAKKK